MQTIKIYNRIGFWNGLNQWDFWESHLSCSQFETKGVEGEHEEEVRLDSSTTRRAKHMIKVCQTFEEMVDTLHQCDLEERGIEKSRGLNSQERLQFLKN